MLDLACFVFAVAIFAAAALRAHRRGDLFRDVSTRPLRVAPPTEAEERTAASASLDATPEEASARIVPLRARSR